MSIEYSLTSGAGTEISPQLEMESIAAPAPAEWEQYKVRAGLERAGDVIPIRRVGKAYDIDCDGEMLRATLQSRGRVFIRFPDGKLIQEHGFDKAMSKVAVARQHAREYRLAVARSKQAEERERELREQIEKAAQEAAELRERERARGERMASAIESEPAPTKPREANKLAEKSEPDPENFQPRFINPKLLIGIEGNPNWNYPTPPKFLKFIRGVTTAEREIYGWMIFRANDDGIFRRSILSLQEDSGLSDRGVQKAVDSLEYRRLILKTTNRAGERRPNEYAFLYHEVMDQAAPTSEQRSSELASGVRQTSEQRSCSNNKEPKNSNSNNKTAEAIVEKYQKFIRNMTYARSSNAIRGTARSSAGR